jgi:hypothetical protein
VLLSFGLDACSINKNVSRGCDLPSGDSTAEAKVPAAV